MPRVIGWAVALLWLPGALIGGHAQEPSQRELIQKLGPGGLLAIPDNLAEVVRRSQAAVIAEVTGFGPLAFRDALSPAGAKLGTEGFATYRVRVIEVLYNKLGEKAPALAQDADIELTQPVGREEAEAFVERRSPIRAEDQCLLFLWYRPREGTWTMFEWPFSSAGRAKRRDGPADEQRQVP